MLQLIRVTQQRGTTVPALIKFVQLIPKSHHDTVKQEAAEEPPREYNQLYYTSGLRLGVLTKETVNRIPTFLDKK